MTDIEKLQKYLPLIRNAAGWTAEELGNKIGVTKQTISNLENQKTKMTKTQYLAIQMVISQKIATTQNDLTLANIMHLVVDSSEEKIINYDAIPQALQAASTDDTSALVKTNNTKNKKYSGATVGGMAGAFAMLGLGPIGAVSAAVLGATIAPWLNKALDDNSKE